MGGARRDLRRAGAGRRAAPGGQRARPCSDWGWRTVLRLSPDGVRAAVVVDGPEGLALYVGTVVRAEDGSVALRDLRDVAPSLSQVADVAWGDSDTLLVLAGDAGEDRIVPYAVGRGRLGTGRGAHRRAAQPADRDRRRRPPGSPWSTPATPSGSWPAAPG